MTGSKLSKFSFFFPEVDLRRERNSSTVFVDLHGWSVVECVIGVGCDGVIVTPVLHPLDALNPAQFNSTGLHTTYTNDSLIERPVLLCVTPAPSRVKVRRARWL